MACKVAPRGLFARLFRSEPQPSRASLACRDLARNLEDSDAAPETTDKIRSCIQAVTSLLDADSNTSAERSDVVECLLSTDMPLKILEQLPQLDFEVAKDCMRLFNEILLFGTQPVITYICSQKQFLQMLLRGCGNAKVSLQSNMMLRSCAKHAQLVQLLLDGEIATGLIALAQQPDFDICSDAFCSLRELLLTCKSTSSAYIEANFESFFLVFHNLLLSDEYFTKRSAISLLADLLLDAEFFRIVSKYASSEKFLKVHMNILRDSSKAIQADAFRTLSIFVAKSDSSSRVHRILYKNKDRLLSLLESMGMSNMDDEESEQSSKQWLQFAQDIEALPTPKARAASVAASDSSDCSTTISRTSSDDQTSFKQVSMDDYSDETLNFNMNRQLQSVF